MKKRFVSGGIKFKHGIFAFIFFLPKTFKAYFGTRYGKVVFIFIPVFIFAFFAAKCIAVEHIFAVFVFVFFHSVECGFPHRH